MFEKLIRSSQDPEQVSLTVKSFLMSLVGVGTLLGPTIGIDALPALEPVVDAVSTALGTAVLLISQVGIAWGLIRKMWAK